MTTATQSTYLLSLSSSGAHVHQVYDLDISFSPFSFECAYVVGNVSRAEWLFSEGIRGFDLEIGISRVASNANRETLLKN